MNPLDTPIGKAKTQFYSMNSFKNSFLLFDSEDSVQVDEGVKKNMILEGFRLPDMVSLHKILKSRLILPPYSVPNLDSLDEILNDPDWLETHGGIGVEIHNYPQLLHFEPVEKKQAFITILNSMAESLGYYAISIQKCKEIERDLEVLHLNFHLFPISK